MSTILCQQPSQPSMDSSLVVEATTMRLKLVSPKSYNQKTLFAGWNLLQSPSSYKPIDDYFKSETTNLYLYNQESLKLSQKSLELCTESLGSETGSDTTAVFTFPDSSLSSTKSRRDQVVESKKVLSRSFPPPLTTISGSKPFQVKHHREGGRLIIEATETNLGNNVLQAERSHGRLRLTCLKDEEGEFHHENEMKDLGKGEEEMERNVVVENVLMLRRCNEDEHGDKGMCCNIGSLVVG